ncbi:MAG: hypothetical protein DBX60_06920 [Bacillota bacterium]|nr:MAG: hypothetical protein DBX60_06920 [Bacillota bacterium]
MKTNLPFWMSLRLSLHGRWVTKCFTVLLSAAALMLFAIASTAFTFDVFDFQVRGYQYYMSDKDYYLFSNTTSGTGYAPGDPELLLTEEEVVSIESGVDLNFVTSCRNQIDVGYFFDKSYFRGEKYKYDENEEIEDYTDEYKAYLKEVEGRSLAYSVSDVTVGSEATYDDLNYRLLAGRYPEAVNEIAVSEEIYEMFAWGGYVDAIAEGCYTLQEFTFVFEKYEAYAWDDTVIPPEEAREAIKSYDDLLGKTLANYELQEENSNERHETMPDEVVIVGIVEMENRPAWPRRYSPPYFSGILRSEAWRQEQIAADKLYAEALVARNFNNSEQVVRDAVSLTLELSELARPRFEGLTPYVDLNVGAYTVSSLADHIVDSNLYILILIVCDVGVVFLVFAVLLNAHLITAIMEMKRKQIGVLRALGGSERRVRVIYLTGTAVLGVCIFLLSLVFTVAVFYGFWQEMWEFSSFGVSPFVFNGWNVLILAVLSFAVPLLSALVPLKRFFKKSIVDNISGENPKK